MVAMAAITAGSAAITVVTDTMEDIMAIEALLTKALDTAKAYRTLATLTPGAAFRTNSAVAEGEEAAATLVET